MGGHALRLQGHGAESRFRAAAHAYDADVVCGRSLAQQSARYEQSARAHKLTVHHPSEEGSFREASAAFLRCHDEVPVSWKVPPPPLDLPVHSSLRAC